MGPLHSGFPGDILLYVNGRDPKKSHLAFRLGKYQDLAVFRDFVLEGPCVWNNGCRQHHSVFKRYILAGHSPEIQIVLFMCRTILARAMGLGADPVQLEVSVKPFPWPSVKFDPAAIAAAAAFNLLLVFAFLTPTRGAVATIVREKELRLREGMRILGLKVPLYQTAAQLLVSSTVQFDSI